MVHVKLENGRVLNLHEVNCCCTTKCENCKCKKEKKNDKK